MFSKLNILIILIDHLNTMKLENGRHSYVDLVIFFAVPAIISMLLVAMDVNIGNDFQNILVAIFAIMTGMLLNLLILVHALSKSHESASFKTLMTETSNNISFGILVSLAVVFTSTIQTLSSGPWKLAATIFTYYLIGVFALNVFMILKRVHIAISEDMRS